jgi:hypothetical protein
MSERDVDRSRGVWRRVWASYLRGKRINSVSIGAEAYYWRLTVAVDDFGNIEAEPFLLQAATAGRRKLTAGQCIEWANELIEAGLLGLYEYDEDEYLHITEFVGWQPAGRNGKRVRRFPASPWDNDESANDYMQLGRQMVLRSQGESKLVQGNPAPATREKADGAEEQDDRGNPSHLNNNNNNNNNLIRESDDSLVREVKGLEKAQYVVEGFEYWKQVMQLDNSTQLGPERQKKLGERWADTSLYELRLAIDGCQADDFSMARGKYEGDNEHNDIKLICKDRAKVEFFMKRAKKVVRKPEDKKRRSEESKNRWSKNAK